MVWNGKTEVEEESVFLFHFWMTIQHKSVLEDLVLPIVTDSRGSGLVASVL